MWFIPLSRQTQMVLPTETSRECMFLRRAMLASAKVSFRRDRGTVFRWAADKEIIVHESNGYKIEHLGTIVRQKCVSWLQTGEAQKLFNLMGSLGYDLVGSKDDVFSKDTEILAFCMRVPRTLVRENPQLL